MSSLRSAARAARSRWREISGLYRGATATWRMLPHFLIIGASKCGTTSLYDTLIEHPSVRPAATKEVHFFDVRFDRGVAWYQAQFPLRRSGRQAGADITGEASPYYIFHPHCPARVKQTLPEVKLIAMFRNPVERAYSQYQHEVRVGREPLTFEEAIEREGERLHGERQRMLLNERYHSFNYRRYSYLARGIYIDQLHHWLEHFDRRQLLVVRSEDLFTNAEEAIDGVRVFLELSPWRPKSVARHNVGAYSKINPETRKRLADYFAPHNERLYAFLGRDFGWY